MRFYKNFVIVWLCIYLTIAFVGRFTSYHKEYFPFFRWSLFSKTPNQIKIPYVMVTKIKDSIFNEPKNILDLKNIHQTNTVSLNLSVKNFHECLINPTNLNSFHKETFLKILPQKSDFKLFVKEIDLSKKDYKSHTKTNLIATIKNNNVTKIERTY